MKVLFVAMFPAVLALLGPVDAIAAEKAPYDVLTQDGTFEIREYASHILAETVVEGNLEEAGNKAFSRLFAYISGENTSRDKIAMASPVSQQPAGEKIAMTAPVSQQSTGDSWAAGFMMPEAYSMETLPEPAGPLVGLRQVPPRTMAAVRYPGFWSEKKNQKHTAELEDLMAAMNLVNRYGHATMRRLHPGFCGETRFLWRPRRAAADSGVQSVRHKPGIASLHETCFILDTWRMSARWGTYS